MLQPHTYQPPEDGLPPQEVRIVELKAEAWPEDAKRIRVSLEILPFIERPDLNIWIENANAQELASINIIESIETRMTFTMHLRGSDLSGPYTLSANILYQDLGVVDQQSTQFTTDSMSA